MPSRRIHSVQRSHKIGTMALVLLVLAACTTAPAKVVCTPRPPEQEAVLIVPRSSPPPHPVAAEIPSSALLPAETIATPPPAVPATEPIIAAAPIESAPATTAIPIQPEYYRSVATYYAKRFKGRRTASGERYNPALMTAATRDFPLQSWLKVINPANGKEVTVRINDRTGKRKTPLIDLSRAAATKLGFLGKGKIQIHVIPIPPPA